MKKSYKNMFANISRTRETPVLAPHTTRQEHGLRNNFQQRVLPGAFRKDSLLEIIAKKWHSTRSPLPTTPRPKPSQSTPTDASHVSYSFHTLCISSSILSHSFASSAHSRISPHSFARRRHLNFRNVAAHCPTATTILTQIPSQLCARSLVLRSSGSFIKHTLQPLAICKHNNSTVF